MAQFQAKPDAKRLFAEAIRRGKSRVEAQVYAGYSPRTTAHAKLLIDPTVLDMIGVTAAEEALYAKARAAGVSARDAMQACGFAPDAGLADPLFEHPRKVRFGEAIARGESKLEALKTAGYETDPIRAKILLQDPVVKQAIDIAKGIVPIPDEPGKVKKPPRKSSAKDVDMDFLVKEQLEAIEAAKTSGAIGHLNTGIKQLAQLTGQWVERSESKVENSTPEVEPERMAQALLALLHRVVAPGIESPPKLLELEPLPVETSPSEPFHELDG